MDGMIEMMLVLVVVLDNALSLNFQQLLVELKIQLVVKNLQMVHFLVVSLTAFKLLSR
jgi:hypothetical protein